MRQTAPDPRSLKHLVEQLTYKPGWTIRLGEINRGQGCEGLTLVISACVDDTNPPHHPKTILHYMPVPPAAFNDVSWRRWLFEQILLVERHEAAEFFRIDGKQPYAPVHAPGYDPYQVFEPVNVEAQQTNFHGEFVGDLTPEMLKHARDNVRAAVAEQRAGERLGDIGSMRLD